MPVLSNAYASLPDNPPGIVTLGQETFGRGVISVVDESKLPRNALKEARNITMAEDGAPKVRPGVGWYGTAPSSSAIDGAGMFVASDETSHLVVVAGGKVYRSLDDGASWAVCSAGGNQNVFTAGHKVRSEQANNFMYLYNGWDNIVRYNGTTTLSTYTALPTPTTNGLTKTGLAGSSQPYTYRYRVSAVNQIGYTIASTALTITSDRTRNTFDATNFITFKWNSVAGAVRYDVYVGLTAGEEVYIDSAENTLEYQDKGLAIEQVSIVAPDSNTTQGPRVGDIQLVGSRLYATNDRDFPYRIWMSAGGRQIGQFGSAQESAYLDWQIGGQIKPVKVENYRKGNNEPIATVWCRSKDGNGAVLQGQLEVATIDDFSYIIPNFFQLPGSRGTEAPDSVVNVLNDYMYYNAQAIYNLGSRAQFLNLLSTDEASANIRPHVKRIRKSAAKGIVSHFQDAKVYMSVPYDSDSNNHTIIFDTERKAWLPEGFTIGFEGFLSYADNTSKQDIHMLCWKDGDDRLSVIDETIYGDYGQPFGTTLTTGLMHINPKDRFEFMWCDEAEIELAQPQGEIVLELSGITREEGFKLLAKPKHIKPIRFKYSWSLQPWSTFMWSDTDTEVSMFTETSTKRYFNVQQDINAYQYRVTTFDLRSDYILRTLQVKGTATIAGKPREWELYDE